jgi:hypothetical protein
MGKPYQQSICPDRFVLGNEAPARRFVQQLLQQRKIELRVALSPDDPEHLAQYAQLIRHRRPVAAPQPGQGKRARAVTRQRPPLIDGQQRIQAAAEYNDREHDKARRSGMTVMTQFGDGKCDGGTHED